MDRREQHNTEFMYGEFAFFDDHPVHDIEFDDCQIVAEHQYWTIYDDVMETIVSEVAEAEEVVDWAIIAVKLPLEALVREEEDGA